MEEIDLQWFADCSDCSDCDCYCDPGDCLDCDCSDCSDCSDCDCYCDPGDCSDCSDCSDCVCQAEVRENLAKALNKNQIFVSRNKDGISTPKTYGSVVRSQNIQDTHVSKVLKENMDDILVAAKDDLLKALRNLQKANRQARLAFNALEG